MSSGIFLIKDNHQLIEMNEAPYQLEYELQKLLENYPNLLPGDQIDRIDPRRWLLVKPEMGVPSQANGYDRWALDHLFLDQDGIPTFVEVKRSTDTRIRREVVGQMLDYAANAIVYWPIEKISDEFEKNCQAKNQDSQQIINEFLGNYSDISEFWTKVKTNLQAGKIRLIFVADKIPPELQRVVEFLHQQMNPAKVFAIEIKQYIEQGHKVLVPTVIGQTIDVKNPEYSKKIKNQWDEASLLAQIETKFGVDTTQLVRKILEWAYSKVQVEWGEGPRYGSFITKLDYQSKSISLFSLSGDGKIIIEKNIDKNLLFSEEKILKFNSCLSNLIEKVYESGERIIKIETLASMNDEGIKLFIETFDWVIDDFKSIQI